jgi:hypothetical protein
MIDAISDISEKSTATAEALEILDLKRKLAKAEEKLTMKKHKRQKRVEKKTTRLRVTDVPEINHLEKGQKYILREYVRVVLWRSVKYWPDGDTEKIIVNIALKQLDIREKANRKRYSDYACAHLQDLIIMKRNNAVAALKKAVTDDRNVESKYTEGKKIRSPLPYICHSNRVVGFRIRVTR